MSAEAPTEAAYIYDALGYLCTTACLARYRYTSKERDTESGNDYFGARHYASTMGRFLSPDPSGLDYADFSSPQTLNLYSYAVNNPLRYIDPTGMVLCDYGSSDQGGEDYEDADSNGECTSNGGALVNVQQGVTVNANNSGGPDTNSSSLSDFLSDTAERVSDFATQANNWLHAPRDLGCMAGFTAGGAATGASIGAVSGGAVGATGGTFVAPGVGTIGGGIVLSGAGAWTGTQIGTIAGTGVGFIACAKGTGPSFGGNSRQNKQANDAKRAAESAEGKKMSPAQEDKFHDEVSHQGFDYHDMVEIARAILRGEI